MIQSPDSFADIDQPLRRRKRVTSILVFAGFFFLVLGLIILFCFHKNGGPTDILIALSGLLIMLGVLGDIIRRPVTLLPLENVLKLKNADEITFHAPADDALYSWAVIHKKHELIEKIRGKEILFTSQGLKIAACFRSEGSFDMTSILRKGHKISDDGYYLVEWIDMTRFTILKSSARRIWFFKRIPSPFFSLLMVTNSTGIFRNGPNATARYKISCRDLSNFYITRVPFAGVEKNFLYELHRYLSVPIKIYDTLY